MLFLLAMNENCNASKRNFITMSKFFAALQFNCAIYFYFTIIRAFMRLASSFNKAEQFKHFVYRDELVFTKIKFNWFHFVSGLVCQ